MEKERLFILPQESGSKLYTYVAVCSEVFLDKRESVMDSNFLFRLTSTLEVVGGYLQYYAEESFDNKTSDVCCNLKNVIDMVVEELEETSNATHELLWNLERAREQYRLGTSKFGDHE